MSRFGGGISLYIGENLNYKERLDLAVDEVQNLCLLKHKEKNVTIGIVYRPPDSNSNEFLSDLDQVLEKTTEENKLVFSMGEWNLNLITCNHHCHKGTSDLLDLLYSRMFFQLLTRPTRNVDHHNLISKLKNYGVQGTADKNRWNLMVSIRSLA